MDILYADLCELGERATRENSLGIKLVPTILGIRDKTEVELEKRGKLTELIEKWSKTA